MTGPCGDRIADLSAVVRTVLEAASSSGSGLCVASMFYDDGPLSAARACSEAMAAAVRADADGVAAGLGVRVDDVSPFVDRVSIIGFEVGVLVHVSAGRDATDT